MSLQNRLTGALNLSASIVVAGGYILIDYATDGATKNFDRSGIISNWVTDNWGVFSNSAYAVLALNGLDGISDIITGHHRFLLTRPQVLLRHYLSNNQKNSEIK